MVEAKIITESAKSFVLEYRLTEADVRHYATSGKVRACHQLCRRQGLGLLPLVAIGLLLFGLFYWSHGFRSVGLMLVTFLAVLGALGWLRWSGYCRRECRLAHDVGVPLDLHLSVSPSGITKDASADDSDPSRTFAWSEVLEIGRVHHMSVIHLRPAGGVLLIPDRAFPDDQARNEFETEVRGWQRAERLEVRE
jgi:hypothetical protein